MKIDELAINLGNNCRLGEPSADFLGDIKRRNRPIELFTAAIRQNYGKHECAIRLVSEMAVRTRWTISQDRRNSHARRLTGSAEISR
jgi:hypothetical protein